jgi:hypothetical protein
VLRQHEHVVGALPELGDAELDHIEPEVEILAERAAADGVVQIDVRGADDPDVGLSRRAAAEALKLPCLQHAQELHLPREREIADLVQEARPAVSLLEATRARA